MKTNNKTWKPVTISGFTGILMGAGAMKGVQMIQSSQTDSTAEVDDHVEPLKTTAPSDGQSFREAFDTARAELGPGGIFSWHGNLYNTYSADEWNAMSDEEKNTFAQQVAPEVSPEDIDTSELVQAENVETPADVDVDVTIAPTEEAPKTEEPDMVAANDQSDKSDDDDVRVVGFGEITLDNGQNVTVQELDYNGQRVAVIDLDQDGEADIAMSDLNNNRQMDEGEVIDLHTGEALSFTNDEESIESSVDTFDA